MTPYFKYKCHPVSHTVLPERIPISPANRYSLIIHINRIVSGTAIDVMASAIMTMAKKRYRLL